SFSFAPNPGWTRAFSPQPEILTYLQECARRHGILPHLRLGHSVTSASWEEDRQAWRIETTEGTYTANVVVSGVGGLSEPSVPKLAGLDRFEGPAFHSARWDHGVPLEGRRVA